MPIFLRQSTASQEIPLGYFLDSTDGDTAETALSIANTDIKVWKTGATTLASKNSGGGTHISGGVYYATFDATDTDTIGPLIVFVHVAGALAIRVECCVLDEAVYDCLFGTAAWGTGSGLDAAGVRSAVGLATANLDTQLGAIDDYVDTEVAAIKAKTDQLTFTVANHLDVNTLKIGGTTQTARDIGASVLLSSGTGTGQVDLSSGRVKIAGGLRKNVAMTYLFTLVDSAGDPRPGATSLAAQRNIDGAGYAPCTNAPTEDTDGGYMLDISTSDLNGRNILFMITGTGVKARTFTITTVD